MDLVDDVIAALWRSRTVRTLGAFALAGLYYGVVVAGEVGRTGSILFTAIPAALVLLFFWTRPLLAMALSAVGILAMAWAMTNGYYIQNATEQSSAAVAILGAALSADERVRRIGLVFSGYVAVAAALFLVSRLNSGGDPVFALGLPFFFLIIGPWVLARALGRMRGMSVRLDSAERAGAKAERDAVLEVERNRIAREVHDVVAHSLAVVIAQADGARFAAETKPESVAPALDAIGDTARRALGEIRTMLHDLKTSGDSVAPGPADLDGLVEGVRALGTDVEEAVFGEPCELGRDAGLALYRIAQEALTNAVRHGDRRCPIEFEVDWGEREVVLVVTNAVPDTALPASERSGHGIEGMRERAEDAGGDCTAGVGSNGRFRVRVALPVAPAQTEPSEEPASDPLLALLRLQPRAS